VDLFSQNDIQTRYAHPQNTFLTIGEKPQSRPELIFSEHSLVDAVSEKSSADTLIIADPSSGEMLKASIRGAKVVTVKNPVFFWTDSAALARLYARFGLTVREALGEKARFGTSTLILTPKVIEARSQQLHSSGRSSW